MFAELAALRDRLATIPGVATARVGFEEGSIAAEDYPIVRVVPTRLDPGRGYQQRTIEVAIVFGEIVTASEGLETVYSKLSDLEEAIIAQVKEHGGRYVATLTDEDRISTYKLMQVQCEITAERPAPP
jgi:hypothetical protein